MVSDRFTTRLLYPRVQSPPNPMNRRLGEPKNPSGRFADDGKVLSLQGIKPEFLVKPINYQATVPKCLSSLGLTQRHVMKST
jgi:hypothetical protein